MPVTLIQSIIYKLHSKKKKSNCCKFSEMTAALRASNLTFLLSFPSPSIVKLHITRGFGGFCLFICFFEEEAREKGFKQLAMSSGQDTYLKTTQDHVCIKQGLNSFTAIT